MSTLGFGSKAMYSVTSPHSWVNITNLRDLQIPKFVSDKLEETTHGTQALKRYRSGLSDVGDTVIKVLSDFTLAVQRDLRDYATTKTVLWLRVEIPLTDNFVIDNKWIALEYQVDVGEFGPMAPLEANQEIDIIFRFRGTTFTWYDAGGVGVASAV